ncbi:MAG: ribosome maturation factor RimM [Acidimicrobiales bacterium]
MTMPGDDAVLLEVGTIGRPHGIRGDVIVRLLSDRDERLAPGEILVTADGRRLTITASRPHQRAHIVSFAGVADRNGAEALAGTVLMGEPLEDPDALWIHELIGRRLVETDGTERGIVVAVQENPASDLLVTDDDALVPLTFLVDHSGEDLVIDPPAGLFD